MMPHYRVMQQQTKKRENHPNNAIEIQKINVTRSPLKLCTAPLQQFHYKSLAQTNATTHFGAHLWPYKVPAPFSATLVALPSPLVSWSVSHLVRVLN